MGSSSSFTHRASRNSRGGKSLGTFNSVKRKTKVERLRTTKPSVEVKRKLGVKEAEKI